MSGCKPSSPEPPAPSVSQPNKNGLALLRSAITVYYGDHPGSFPTSLEELTRDGKYMSALPSVQLAPHLSTDEVEPYSSRAPRDSGRWGYIGNPKDREWGSVFVDCTHTDIQGTVWAAY